mmetsp:Transcript_51906/g.116917  ORF Transcript_51906/g.116917 Transcript_51906/m.116917 type:complete len:250 (-) Transcript_51906:453-1202(-)
MHHKSSGVPGAPCVVLAALEVHGPHCTPVDASELIVGRLRGRIAAHQVLVRCCELEGELPEEVEHDEPHLHLCKIPTQAAARVMGKGGETVRLRVGRSHGAAHACHLTPGEVPPGVEAVGVCAPEVWVAVPRPVRHLHGRPSWKCHRAAPRADHLLSELEAPESAVWHGRPQPEGLGDATVHELQSRQVAVCGLPAALVLEEAVDLALQVMLELRVSGQLKQHPGHGVASGVMACKDNEQHVAKVGRLW